MDMLNQNSPVELKINGDFVRIILLRRVAFRYDDVRAYSLVGRVKGTSSAATSVRDHYELIYASSDTSQATIQPPALSNVPRSISSITY